MFQLADCNMKVFRERGITDRKNGLGATELCDDHGLLCDGRKRIEFPCEIL